MLLFKNQKEIYSNLLTELVNQLNYGFVTNRVGPEGLYATKLDFNVEPREMETNQLDRAWINIVISTCLDEFYSHPHYLKEKMLPLYQKLEKQVYSFSRDTIDRAKFKFKNNIHISVKFKLDQVNRDLEQERLEKELDAMFPITKTF